MIGAWQRTALLVVLLGVLGGCGDDGVAPVPSTAVTVPSTVPGVASTTLAGPGTTAGAPDRGDVSADFAIDTVTVAGQTWLVAVADTPELRRRGLMFVTDLGELDGMLFVFAADGTGGFWMKDTLIPLEVAFFDAAGVLVDVLGMVPCEEDPCPSYVPSGPYRLALEAEPGPLAGLSAGARLVLSGG